jgi:predicted enzyme related to lactoylglutathione lyase
MPFDFARATAGPPISFAAARLDESTIVPLYREEPPMRLFRLAIPVNDMTRADAFYSRVFGQPPDPVAPTRHYYECGEIIIACVDPREHGGEFRPNPDLIYFAVDDLEATRAMVMAAGAQALETEHEEGQDPSAIMVRPWGERSFYCLDPFGNPLCFVDRRTLFLGSRPS